MNAPSAADVATIAVVRDAQVAVTVRSVITELSRLAAAADLRGLGALASGIREERGRLAGLLGRAP